KAHTTRMAFAAALQLYATRPTPTIPLPPRTLDDGVLRRLGGHLRQRLEEVQTIRRLTRETVPVLKDMLTHQQNAAKFNDLFRKLKRNQTKVESRPEAFALVTSLNTIGAFHRARNDRAIHHQQADPMQRQARQIERDLKNLDWTLQACDETV